MSDLWRLTCYFSSATCRLSEWVWNWDWVWDCEFGFAFASVSRPLYHYKLLCWWNTWFCLSNLHSLWAICRAWHAIFRRLHTDCLRLSETVWDCLNLRLRLSSASPSPSAASPSPSAPSPLWSSDFVYSVYVTTLLMLLIWMIMHFVVKLLVMLRQVEIGKHCSFVCRRTVATPNGLNA